MSPKLSPRQAEVMSWLARGKTCSTIGTILGISTHTVTFYKREVLARMGVASTVTACCILVRDGHIQLPA